MDSSKRRCQGKSGVRFFKGKQQGSLWAYDKSRLCAIHWNRFKEEARAVLVRTIVFKSWEIKEKGYKNARVYQPQGRKFGLSGDGVNKSKNEWKSMKFGL